MCHVEKAPIRGKFYCEKLKVLFRQQFKILSSVIGVNNSEETISSFRKDVTAKLYGDVTRKNKLLYKKR